MTTGITMNVPNALIVPMVLNVFTPMAPPPPNAKMPNIWRRPYTPAMRLPRRNQRSASYTFPDVRSRFTMTA